MKAIDGSGRDMRLPNVCLAPETETTLRITDYTTDSVTSVTVANTNIAEATLSGDMLTIKAKNVGQTALTMRCGAEELHATITVREGVSDNGWL